MYLHTELQLALLPPPRSRIPYLLLTGEKELVRINSVNDSRPKKWDDVEDDRWFIRVCEEELLDNVENSCDDTKGKYTPKHQHGSALLRKTLSNWVQLHHQFRKYAHFCLRSTKE